MGKGVGKNQLRFLLSRESPLDPEEKQKLLDEMKERDSQKRSPKKRKNNR